MGTYMSREGAKTWWNVDLPREVAYLYKDMRDNDWKPVTCKEILDKKRQKQANQLRNKRLYPSTVPGFIHVFFNDSWIMGGWYTYIMTSKSEWALNFRWLGGRPILYKVMQLVPCGVLPIRDNKEEWMKAFAKRYPHVGFKRKKNQGLLRCKCILDEYGNLVDIEI